MINYSDETLMDLAQDLFEKMVVSIETLKFHIENTEESRHDIAKNIYNFAGFLKHEAADLMTTYKELEDRGL